MTVNFNPSINPVFSNLSVTKTQASKQPEAKTDFKKALAQGLNNVNELHNKADASIVDLLTGKNQDINSVVASVAKADMSFKLLVGVRDKLVEAYKETMKMQI